MVFRATDVPNAITSSAARTSAISRRAATDTAQLQAALAAANTAGGGVIELDDRTYTLTQKITLPDVPISLVGKGERFTELRWTCADGGLLYEPTVAPGRDLHIRDLSLTTNQEGGGSALEASWPEVEGQYARTLRVERCSIRGTGFSYAWTKGLDLSGARKSLVSDTHILGVNADNTVMTHGIALFSEASSCIPIVRNCYILQAYTGIEITEDDPTGPEGVLILGTSIVKTYDGIVCTTSEPQFVVDGCHIKSERRCVTAGAIRGAIVNNHLHVEDSGESGQGAVYLTGDEMTVANNHLRGPDNATSHGVVVMTGAERCAIHHNNFYDWQNGVLVNAGAVDTLVDHNRGWNLGNAIVSDSGTDTLAYNNSSL